MSDDDKLSNSVGYKKPPREKQFKPGQSGNPKGRPKGAKNLTTILCKELDSRIAVTESGKPKSISKKEAIVKQAVNKAIRGDARATALILSEVRSQESQGNSGSSLSSDIPTAAEDKRVMESIVRRIRASSPAPCGESGLDSPKSDVAPAAESKGESE